MKRYTYYIIGALFGAMLSGLVACQEDALEQLPQGGIEEGMVSFQLRAVSGEQILTKGNENDKDLYDLDEPIHNVYLMLFDTKGNKINTAYQHLVDNNTVVNLYLPKDANRVYAFCNLQNTTILTGIATEEDLKRCNVTISKPQDAYTGSFVLSGSTLLEKTGNDEFASEYIIPMTRLAARLIFEIRTELPVGDEFKIGSVYMHYIPKGSRLLEQPAADTLKAAELDYTYAPTAGDRINKYFSTNGTHDSLWIDLKPKGNTYTATVHLFENRQGGAEEKLDAGGNPTDKENSYWKAIASLPDDQYLYYRQIFKKRLADSLGIDYASYLTINGFYTTAGKAARKVTYYVYVGKDNYKDFNIRRNHSYLHKITIKAKDMLDSRVITSGTGRIEVESQLGGNHVLDAHCNVSEALIFAETGWTVRVADPDRTPWLEVSKSPVYRPRIVGESGEDRASFKVSGAAGLDYFYVHTDEYVPEIKQPSDNNILIDPDRGFSNIREGKLICESANGGYKEIVVRQYAAQMVVLDAKYLLGPDGLVWKEVRDTFYVERCLEERNLEWGFNQYWCHTLNVMIGWGNWDGLWNTRNLYRVALQGDDLGGPAYPAAKGGIPADIALGYAINKNRDRNGNGMIDYDEIMWYLPALNELNALCSSIHGKDNTNWTGKENWGTVWLDEENTTYHSSTPSVADPAGVTPGRNYYVDFLKEKQGICLRTRRCNVICMRRKGAWRGPTTGEADGNIDIDTGWAGDDEMVMPKETK